MDAVAPEERRCTAVDHLVWADGSCDSFQCELPEGHAGEHMGDRGMWAW